MTNKTQNIEEHVGELLSGYVDGELTQQERQRVEIHCNSCKECESSLEELRELRERVGKSKLSEFGQDVWREKMNDTAVKASRGAGWLLFIGFVLAGAGYGVYEFVIDSSMSLLEKFLVGGIYLGLALLFLSVLRQRLIERKTDKYKDVEI
jgi:hypothetical protein